MANTIELKQQIAQGEYDAAFTKLYGAAAVQEQRKRYTDLINEFEKAYGTERTVRLYSAPGRTEIGGNHTDHNNGVVLAGSVNLDMVAVQNCPDRPVRRECVLRQALRPDGPDRLRRRRRHHHRLQGSVQTGRGPDSH